MNEPKTYDDWVNAYRAGWTPKAEKHGEICGPCPHCGGVDRFHIKDGDSAVLTGCRRCGAEFLETLKALFPDDDWKPQNPATPKLEPVRWGCTLEQLATKVQLPASWLSSALGWQDGVCWISHEVGEVSSVYMPYTEDGKIISEKHRVRVEGSDKYRYVKGRTAALYGADWLDVARENGKLIMVEGETDAATLWRHEMPAVGIPGCDSVKVIEPHHMEGIRRVYVVEEHDEAGSGFPAKVAERLKSIGADAVVLVVRLPCADTNAQHRADPRKFLGIFKHACTYARGLRKSRIPQSAIITAADLNRREFPSAEHIIPGILPQGLSLLFAAPKVGKSFMALQAAVAVGCGQPFANLGAPVERAEVLIIDLEQPIAGEMQDRYRSHLAFKAQHNITIIEEWPRISDGCMEELDIWMDEHPDCKLVIIDVYSSIKPLSSPSGTNAYDHEYQYLTRLRDFFQRRMASCVLVHHDKKGVGQGMTESPSGSKAVTGTPNALLRLERQIGDSTGTLTITGRSVEETTLDAAFQKTFWALSESAGHGW